ncbi:MAG: FAD/NAD(P)-binding oxidoreductase [Actinomycetota bacterium]|jgi:sulfide:quinone oxidoreductase|nr:FAD/NAD(P)-binding oxidoreductase [Actinomycetota bacterium]
MAHVIVLGGGFGGLAAAHELRQELPDEHRVTLVAADDRFFVGFAKLWDLVGTRPLEEGTGRLDALAGYGIAYVEATITRIDPERRRVETSVGAYDADFLVVALGATDALGPLDGLQGVAYDLYDPEALPAMRAALGRLDAGRLVVPVLGGPYKCPPAPYEAAFLLDEHLRRRGVRDRVEVVVTTPLPTSLPAAGSEVSDMVARALAERDIELRTGLALEAIDAEDQTLRFVGGATLSYTLALAVPEATPPVVVAESALAGNGGWIWPDRASARTRFERVYAAGDCTSRGRLAEGRSVRRGDGEGGGPQHRLRAHRQRRRPLRRLRLLLPRVRRAARVGPRGEILRRARPRGPSGRARHCDLHPPRWPSKLSGCGSGSECDPARTSPRRPR